VSPRQEEQPTASTTDPLRLCVSTTVALLTWLTGPAFVPALAGLAFFGYLRARRTGLTSSRCILRDTRLVLGYLGLVGLASVVALAWDIHGLLG